MSGCRRCSANCARRAPLPGRYSSRAAARAGCATACGCSPASRTSISRWRTRSTSTVSGSPASRSDRCCPRFRCSSASTLALEALKFLIRLNQPTLVNKVLVFDGLLSETRTHPVLVKPFCPTCSKKKGRQHPHRPGAPEHGTAAACSTSAPVRRSAGQRTQRYRRAFRRGVEGRHRAAASAGVARQALQSSLPFGCRGVAPVLLRKGGDQGRRVDVLSGRGGGAVFRGVLGRRGDRSLPTSGSQGRSLDPADLVLYRQEQYRRPAVCTVQRRDDIALGSRPVAHSRR